MRYALIMLVCFQVQAASVKMRVLSKGQPTFKSCVYNLTKLLKPRNMYDAIKIAEICKGK